jgi:hypothetical protein
MSIGQRLVVINDGDEKITITFQNLSDSVWKRQVELMPNQIKNIWCINGTFSSSNNSLGRIRVLTSISWPPSDIKYERIRVTPNQTPDQTPTQTPTNTPTPTPTATPTQSFLGPYTNQNPTGNIGKFSNTNLCDIKVGWFVYGPGVINLPITSIDCIVGDITIDGYFIENTQYKFSESILLINSLDISSINDGIPYSLISNIDIPLSGETLLANYSLHIADNNPNNISENGGIYFNNIDNNGVNQTDYFGNMVGNNFLLTIGQNESVAVFSGGSDSVQILNDESGYFIDTVSEAGITLVNQTNTNFT